MSYYSKIGDTLVFSGRRPRRSVFLFVAQNYSVLTGLIVTMITLISIFRYAPILTTVWLTLYWIYKMFRPFIFTIDVSDPSSLTFWKQLARCLIITTFASMLILYIYLNPDYMKDNGTSNTIWLIYILPIFITIQYGDHKLMLISIALAFLSLVVINLAASLTIFHSLIPGLLTNVIVDMLWLFLISFMLYALVRFINDRSADLRLLHDLGQELVGMPAAGDAPGLFAAVVRKIASHFPYSHISIFLLKKDGALECVASSSPEGRELARQGFTLASDDGTKIGIVRHAIETGATYYSNDVRKDKYYRRHPEFQDTRSELAVPIKIDTTTVGVLDIQDRRRGAFLAQDREIMEILADHVGRVMDNVTSLHEIVRSIARRFMSHHELKATLEDIARAAHEELKADIVLLYEHDPLTSQVTLGAYFGEIYDRERFAAMVDSTCPVVERLLSAQSDYYFQADVHAEVTTPLLRWARIHTKSYDLLEREEVVSLATLRFRADNNYVGMMFLTFRSPRTFNESEKGRFYIFADLAALAIQKAQVQQQQIQHEREDLAWWLHDGIMGHAFGISKLISSLLMDRSLSDRHRSRLKTMQEAIQELTKTTKNLHETWKDIPVTDLWIEVDKIVEQLKQTHEVAFNVTYDRKHKIVFPKLVHQLKLILREAIMNALRHGNARNIDLTFEVSNEILEIIVADDGCGFDIEDIEEKGIANMRQRSQRLGGDFRIESAAGAGTRLLVKVPLRYE